jgi:ankyrin repeat protein
MHCLRCFKKEVPLFHERNNVNNVFCSEPCQYAFIGRSRWLDIKKDNIISPLVLWNLIITSRLTLREIASDFFNYYDIPYQELKEHNERVKEMLLWIFNNPQFIKEHWNISRGQFMAYFSQMVIQIDSGEFMLFFIEKLGFNPSMNDNYPIRRASELGSTNIVQILLQDKRVDPSEPNNYAIRWASSNGHLEVIKLLLQDERVDPSAYNNYAIQAASTYGHAEVVELLLQDKRVNPSVLNNYAIRRASEKGHAEVVKLLLQDGRVDPSALNNEAIRWASEDGHAEVVKLLLQDERVDPSALNNTAIQMASKNGHFEVVELLLQDKRVNPSDDDNRGIRMASKNGHVEVVKLLLEDERVLKEMTAKLFDTLKEQNLSISDEIDAARVSWSRGKEKQEEGEGPIKRIKGRLVVK